MLSTAAKLISYSIILPHSPKHFHTHILQPTFCSVPTQKEGWNLKANLFILHNKTAASRKKNPDIVIVISAKIHRIQ